MGLLRVCNNEDEDKDKEKYNEMTEGLNNSVAQRLFIGGSTQPRLPPSSAAGTLITIMPGPMMEGIASFDADGLGRANCPRGHGGED